MKMLKDSFGRTFPYIRLSITDVCNFKCGYCLPNGYQKDKSDNRTFLATEEIERLAKGLSELGVCKIRLTGGEPTVRKDFFDIIKILKSNSGIKKTVITTNGYRLDQIANQIVDSGLDGINISIDSLNRETFKNVTSHDRLPEILKGIEKLQQLNFKNIKINAVLLKGINDSEKDFYEWSNFIKNNEIDLSKLDLFLSLKSFFSSDFLLKRAEVAFIKNDIKDLTKITNIFLPRIINKQLNKIFEKGNLEGKFIIPFEPDGSLGKDYGFYGQISDATINFTKEFSIKNLTTEINQVKEFENNGFIATIKKGSIFDLELADSTINLKREENETKIKSLLHTNGKLNFSQIKIISSLFGLNINFFKDINSTADLKTNINFYLDKKFRIKIYIIFNGSLETNLDLDLE